MVNPVLKIKRVGPEVKLPFYATAGSCCFDICATSAGIVEPNRSMVFHTGLVVEVPTGFSLKLYSRSGHGFKDDVSLANCVGVIDSDYRGELMVKLRNDKDTPFAVNIGDRIVQGELQPVYRTDFQVVDDLTDTARGAGGFGSTGKS